jgi:general secretion pathway protein B
MSYILDALRKSERERRRSSIPDPLTVHEPLPQEGRIRSVRLYLIAATVLLVALISGLWFGVWYAKKSPHQGSLVNQTLRETPAPEPSQIVAQTNTQIKADSKDTLPPVRSSQEITNSQEREKHLAAKREELSHDIMGISQGGSSSAPEPGKEIPPPDNNKLYTLDDLPLSLRQKLPDFTFSIFLYSDEPALRTVRVNGVTMKEGQYISEGLKLEEIIPEGVILSYMNYRFRIRIQ